MFVLVVQVFLFKTFILDSSVFLPLVSSCSFLKKVWFVSRHLSGIGHLFVAHKVDRVQCSYQLTRSGRRRRRKMKRRWRRSGSGLQCVPPLSLDPLSCLVTALVLPLRPADARSRMRSFVPAAQH